MPEIKLEDINALAKEFVSDDNMALVVMAPEKSGVEVPSESDILKIINNSKSTDLQPYVDKFKEKPLVTDDLKGSKVVSRKKILNLVSLN